MYHSVSASTWELKVCNKLQSSLYQSQLLSGIVSTCVPGLAAIQAGVEQAPAGRADQALFTPLVAIYTRVSFQCSEVLCRKMVPSQMLLAYGGAN